MKTNKQIAEECAQAAWSWLCERYDMPIPGIRKLLSEEYSDGESVEMPRYRVSMEHRKGFSVPEIPGSTSGEVVISGTTLNWLPHCRTNNTIESWTLQFVEQFTRAIEMRKRRKSETFAKELSHKAVLNKIEFARLFFPHLYTHQKEIIRQIVRSAKSETRKLQGSRRTRPISGLVPHPPESR